MKNKPSSVTSDSISRVLYSQIKTAAEAWSNIESETMPADRWLGGFFHRNRKKYGSRDRKFISEVVYALFRHKTYLAGWAETLRGARNVILLVLLAGVIENLISETEFTKALAEFNIQDFPPSLYRDLQKRKMPGKTAASWEETMALRHSFPLWLVKRWETHFGMAKTEKIVETLQQRPPLVIRSNPLKISRDDLISSFQNKGIDVMPTENSSCGIVFEKRIQIFNTDEFKKGWFEVQDEGSQMICEWINPAPGELVWDLCAGGGGKALFMAALMRNKGRIIATDIRPLKLLDLKKRAKRAGAFNIFPADLSRMDEIKAVKQGIDKILIDAPCSGTGTFRRNPDAKWKLKESTFTQHQKGQISIINNAIPYLKENGILFYATCSIDSSENEDTVKAVLETHPELALATALNLETGMRTIWPDVNESDGFFLAAIKKRS